MNNFVINWLRKNLKGDLIIWSIVFLLSMLSILVVYSAVSAPAFKHNAGNTEFYLLKHTTLILLSLVAMWLAHKVDYRYYSTISRLLLWITPLLLLYTFFRGSNINEASRWIMIPVINQTFQTSDLAKLALIINLASMLAKRQKNIEDFRRSVFPIMLWCGLICGLIALSDFSTAFLLFMTCMLLMFIGRVPMRYLMGLLGIGILSISLALLVGNRGTTFLSRLSSFASNSSTEQVSELPYQVEQANIAIARGGVVGVGLGQSQQRYRLPEAFSDYIFAIIIEEHGTKIAFLVILLYLALLYRGMIVASRSNRAFGGLLSAGLSFSLVVQAMVNMAVVTGLGPVTGLPLPLLSMGGTSLLFTGLSLGVILSVSRGDIVETSKSDKQTKQQMEPNAASA